MADPRVWAILGLLLLILGSSTAAEELVITRAERRVDLTSPIVRTTVSLKIENTGSKPVSDFVYVIPDGQSEHLATFSAAAVNPKGKTKTSLVSSSAGENSYKITLEKPLGPGQSSSLEIVYSLTHTLKPLPEEIKQGDIQFVLHHDSAYLVSPYPVKYQTSYFKVANRVESYSHVDPTRFSDKEKEIKYGPYENIAPMNEVSIKLHFESVQPFVVAKLVEQEFEISHWGNVYVTENYELKHEGARLSGSFSRLDFQARMKGFSTAFRGAIAVLPPRAHSIYYRDEIGNISTSHVRSESKRTIVEIQPRFPLFGGWQVKFTLGYSVPLQDLVHLSPDGKRVLRTNFGSSIKDVVVDKIVVKVVLPEGSRDPGVSLPFSVDDIQHEVKHTYLDTFGRKVVVLTKQNVVPEHGVPFEVFYKFNPLAMVVEPLMLIFGFFVFFLACMAYLHFDFPISKASGSYQARLQQQELLAHLQRLQKVLKRRLSEVEKLEGALRDLARTGDASACKASKKPAEAFFKESSKEVKSIHELLQASPRSSSVISKVENLIGKEKEKQEKLMIRLNLSVDLYEKKMSSKEIDARLAPHEQKYSQLKADVAALLDSLDD